MKTHLLKRKTLKKTATSVAVMLLIFNAQVHAQQVIYDDSTSATLSTTANDPVLTLGASSPWTGLLNTDQGVVYKDTLNNPVLTGADLVIDYTHSSTATPQFVIGGYSKTQVTLPGSEVQNNTVTVKNGDVSGNVWGGLYNITETTAPAAPAAGSNADTFFIKTNLNISANYNTVNINTDSHNIHGSVYGSNAILWLKTGDATSTGSIVTHADSHINSQGSILNANNNDITLKNSMVFESLYGGSSSITIQTGKVNVTNNAGAGIVQTNNDAQINFSGSTIYANDNKVTLDEYASVTQNIYGGNALVAVKTSSATAQSASTSSQGEAKSVGNSFANNIQLSAERNVVTLGTGSFVNGSIYGGNSTLNIENTQAKATSDINSTAYGNVNASGSSFRADDNKVNIHDATYVAGGGGVYGGNVSYSIIAADSTTAFNNTSTSPTFSEARSNVNANNSTLSASNNTINISNTPIAGNIYGGNIYAYIETGTAHAESNAGATSQSIADSHLYFNNSTLNANLNNITIDRNTNVTGNIFGGNAWIVLKTSNATSTGSTNSTVDADVSIGGSIIEAKDNTVSFDGILINGSIYGGYITTDLLPGQEISGTNSQSGTVVVTNSSLTATNNTVTIGSNTRFNGTSPSIYGGYMDFSTTSRVVSYNAFSGNTLNYAASTPANFTQIGNFENYNFTLTPSLANTGTALITAQDITLGTDASNTNVASVVGTPSKITVVGIHSGNILQANDQFVLMQSSNNFAGSGATANTSAATQVQQGISLLYDVNTYVDTINNQVTATIVGCNTSTGAPCVNPQLKALSEGYLGNTMLLTRGADLIAYDAFNTISQQNNNNGWVPFALASGQHNRYNSGSHVTSNDFLVSGGLSYQQDNITGAAIIEAGWGSYDSYNSFNNATNVDGNGHNNYYGLGLLGRYDFDNGIYTEGSLRYGRSKVKFDTDDITNWATGQNASYDLNANYASAHIGVGYIVPINDKNNADFSAKYLYTTVEGKNVNIGGDPLHFDRVNSSRIRLGVDLNNRYSNTITLHAGAGFEDEFDGKAKATTYSIFDIDAPDVKGSTGILSLGVTAKPSENSKFTIDTKAQGYFGKREGVGVNLRVNYAF